MNTIISVAFILLGIFFFIRAVGDYNQGTTVQQFITLSVLGIGSLYMGIVNLKGYVTNSQTIIIGVLATLEWVALFFAIFRDLVNGNHSIFTRFFSMTCDWLYYTLVTFFLTRFLWFQMIGVPSQSLTISMFFIATFIADGRVWGIYLNHVSGSIIVKHSVEENNHDKD